MTFPQAIPIAELAKQYHARILGDADLMALGINEIHKVVPGDITFSDVPKYIESSLQSAATIIILNQEAACPEGKAILVVENPFEMYDSIVRAHRPFESLTNPVHYAAVIHPTAIVEPGCIIANNVHIGAHSYIQGNCYIGEHTYIGSHVQIGAGSILSTDAFYYKKQADGTRKKWRSGGRLIIQDHVDIGAACTINKGVSGDTVIGRGSKLDCQVHIGHGVVVGENCLFAAQVGIGGKTIIEDEVVLYGQVGVAQAITIGRGAVVLATSGVSKSLEGGKTYFGAPADEVRSKYRELAALRQLPDFLRAKK